MGAFKALFLLTTVIGTGSAFPAKEENLKIYNGKDAEPGQFPFIVSMEMIDFGHVCGASIINANWIVTAAHCLVVATKEQLVILSGTNLLDTGGVNHTVSQIVIHEGFNVSVFKHDIALIKIEGSFVFTDLVQPAKIGEVSANEPVIVAGWGATEANVFPNELKYVELATLTEQECTEKSKGGSMIFERGPGQVCALAGKGVSPCYGDSGGPLIFNETLVGIVSYAVEPCGKGFPDVYVRVAYYVDWINENIAKY